MSFRSTKNYFTFSYSLSIALTAVLGIVGLVWLQFMVSRFERDPNIINIAGRQRMLSQKLAKTALLANQNKDPKYISELQETIELLESSNRLLRGGSDNLGLTANSNGLIVDMFVELEPQLQSLAVSVKQLITSLESNITSDQNDQLIVEILNNEGIFLKRMNEIVYKYTSEVENHLKLIKKTQLIVFICLLGLLVLEALFILRPTDLKLRNLIDELEKQKNLADEKVEKAENSVALQNEFLAAVSHDVRTPLNGIIGMTSLLLEAKLNEEQKEYTLSINRSADSALAIVNDIFDFSQIEIGQLSIEAVFFDLRTLIEDITEMLSLKAEEKDLDLIVNYPFHLPRYLIGDPQRLRQVLSNLLNEVINNTSEGYVLFEVKHKGKDKFIFTITSSHAKEELSGNSLSSVIGKQLIELMKGHFEFDENNNIVISLTLPINRDSPSIDIEPFKDMKIAIVDANALQASILEKQLNSWQIKASIVSSLDQIQTDPFKFIIVDSNCLDSNIQLKQSNTILLTSLTRKNEFESKDYAASLIKPLRIGKLFDTLKSLSRGQSKNIPLVKPASEDKVKLLIVEDNLVNQKVAICMLEKLGYRVDTANNGRIALEKFRTDNYSLIFMDCQMPEMDGYQATREIRKTNNHIPIVAMTANVMKGDREKCFEAGMNGYISKPIKVEDLKESLKYCLNPANNNGHSLDAEVLKTLKALKDEQFFKDILQIFEDNALKDVQILEESLHSNDLSTLKKAAHHLKGACSEVGAKRLSELCKDAETLSSLETADSVITEINQELKKVCQEIKAGV